MKQESRFVAELYRYLAPFIDTDKERYISLDGMAALGGVQVGSFADPGIPDFWFYLVGSPTVVLMEAKILGEEGKVSVGQGQLTAWRTGGPGSHKPAGWVVANERLDTFDYWTHADFCVQRLDRSNSHQDYIRFMPPQARVSFTDVRQLALHVLRQF